MPMKVPVSVEVYTQDGTEYILPSQKDIEKLREIARKQREEGEKLAKVKATKSRGEGQVMAAGYIDRDADTLEEIRAKYMPLCESRTYTLIKPGWGRWQQAISEAKEYQDGGDAILNNEKLMLDLLPDSVEGLTAADVRALSPNIGQLLWSKLDAACRPDLSKLPF